MKRLFLFYIPCLIVMMGLYACGKSAINCHSAGWAFAISNEAIALSEASSAYSLDQSKANCENYKKAYQDYINALKKYEKCLEPSERSSWIQSLNDAEQEIKDLQC